jgi:hypothetical protein
MEKIVININVFPHQAISLARQEMEDENLTSFDNSILSQIINNKEVPIEEAIDLAEKYIDQDYSLLYNCLLSERGEEIEVDRMLRLVRRHIDHEDYLEYVLPEVVTHSGVSLRIAMELIMEVRHKDPGFYGDDLDDSKLSKAVVCVITRGDWGNMATWDLFDLVKEFKFFHDLVLQHFRDLDDCPGEILDMILDPGGEVVTTS